MIYDNKIVFRRLLDADAWWTREEKFDVVSCLNLLDRCSDPAKLLENMKTAVKPGGRIIVALVLPYRPFDEFSEFSRFPSIRIFMLQVSVNFYRANRSP